MQNYATFKGHLVIITALPELYNNIIAYKFNSQDQQILAYIFFVSIQRGQQGYGEKVVTNINLQHGI